MCKVGVTKMPKPFYLTIGFNHSVVGAVIDKMRKTKGVTSLELVDSPKKPNGAATGEKHASRNTFTTTGHDAIIAALFDKAPMSVAQLRALFVEHGRAPASVSSVIHEMIKEGEAVRGPDGYALSKK